MSSSDIKFTVDNALLVVQTACHSLAATRGSVNGFLSSVNSSLCSVNKQLAETNESLRTIKARLELPLVAMNPFNMAYADVMFASPSGNWSSGKLKLENA